MIVRISGRLIEKKETALVLNVSGMGYEVLVPFSVLQRIDDHVSAEGTLELITYHYLQTSPSSATPVLVGFLNEIEREFFLKFIKVSGIGPRAAVRALNKPISEISRAIAENDYNYLKTLPGIGGQKAKEIVAKLQGKVGIYGLIQDQAPARGVPTVTSGLEEEAVELLVQLQYKKTEARDMVQKALDRNSSLRTTEELLNEIFKQRISQ